MSSTNAQLGSTIEITAEPLTAERFAEFGEVLSPRPSAEPDFIGHASVGWDSALYVSGRPQLLVLRTPFVDCRVPLLERHPHVTQAIIPLSTARALFLVAPPASRPDLVDLRAFLIDGSCGYLLHRNTWHSPDRYPVSPPGADYALLTEWETTGAAAGGERSARTEELDCRAHFGVDIRLVLPKSEEPR